MTTMEILAWIFLGFGLFSFLLVLIDILLGRYQSMPIMNIAWPITALYSGPIALFMYYNYARAPKMSSHHDHKPSKRKRSPFWVQVYISCTHCGAGCALADIVAEVGIFWIGIMIFGHSIWASYFIDYGLALLFGFIFQYLNIRPMKPELSTLSVIEKSIQADFWSLTTFQIGMYGWLLAVYFIYGKTLNAGMPLYWFMMQIGLTIGLLTTYPVNYWLVKKKIKLPCAH